MRLGVQFTGSLSSGPSKRLFTFNLPANWHVIWYVVPTAPKIGVPQIQWDVTVERASNDFITYWITVKNISSETVNTEARYTVLNR